MKKIAAQTAKNIPPPASTKGDLLLGKRTRSIVLINNFENSKCDEDEWTCSQDKLKSKRTRRDLGGEGIINRKDGCGSAKFK
jgi:hypothetical protein